ncbi:response regulator transcription factor [Leptospira sarikeiensis]|uniref:DNA-binding response regulator n=1 Tax=Leptospira sarikeiensis TaxID=2484943 RepID=A0A4V6QM41_9LEPT|nr:response regulator transcription factor [Leptospira sarikeiensis]TGL57706.1 DNA-binding response regulator [Leptospira sarikeiensis]
MPVRTRPKIFLIDDHPIVRSGLESEIKSSGEFEHCGSASSIKEGLKAMTFAGPDLLICDVSLQDENGIKELDSLKKKFPDLKIVFLTMHRDWSYLQDAISAGADGYLLKSDSMESIMASIRKILNRGKVFPGEITNFSYDSDWIKKVGEVIQKLTKREAEILHFLSKGRLNREIASELNVSIRTVEAHRASIFKKLEVENVVELTRILVQLESSEKP